jgi:DNA-binding transcriptional ArsR family regulator
MKLRRVLNPKRSADPEVAANAIDMTLSALADPQRREVIEILRDRPRAAGELARLVGVSAPAMSRQLRTLRESGLVSETHAGFDARVRVYQLVPAPMEDLKTWLEETERLWSRQLMSFKVHLEKTKRRK